MNYFIIFNVGDVILQEEPMMIGPHQDIDDEAQSVLDAPIPSLAVLLTARIASGLCVVKKIAGKRDPNMH